MYWVLSGDSIGLQDCRVGMPGGLACRSTGAAPKIDDLPKREEQPDPPSNLDLDFDFLPLVQPPIHLSSIYTISASLDEHRLDSNVGQHRRRSLPA